MVNQIISFILKDKFTENDNLIFIELNEQIDFKITCTCDNPCCNHCDYVVKKISLITKQDVNFEEEFNLVSFKNDDFIKIDIQDYESLQNHTIYIKFEDNEFSFKCSCCNPHCLNISYCVIQILLNYNKEKEKLHMNQFNKDLSELAF